MCEVKSRIDLRSQAWRRSRTLRQHANKGLIGDVHGAIKMVVSCEETRFTRGKG
jgi:hypothetical protein